MKNLLSRTMTKISSTFSGAVLAFTFLASGPSAQAALVSHNLFWTGDAGYSMTGMFGFDDQSIPVDGIIRKDELEFMMISFFDPSDVLLQEFNYDFPEPDTSGEFSFNFNTVTREVIQSGFPIGEEGLDLGIDNSSLTETGLDFYSCRGDAVFEGECRFSSLGEGIILQQNNVEGACFNFPNSDCVDLDGGGVVTAELKIVPEPNSLVGLLALGFLKIALKVNLLRYRCKVGWRLRTPKFSK